MREPNFENLLKVLRRQAPPRPTLFEFFLNGTIYRHFVKDWHSDSDPLGGLRTTVKGYHRAGYDYVTILGADMWFRSGTRHAEKSISQNEGGVITDRKSYDSYEWPDPDKADFSRLEKIAPDLPDGMKIVLFGPGGVLENAITIVGYENLCVMSLEDPELTEEIFRQVGSRLVRFYEIASPVSTVGAVISNDDWGFRTQTVFPPENMRKFVFPWHAKIVETIHRASKPAILHSCGQLEKVMDDIIDGLRYDAKHSYEDRILPVEEAYERYHERVAILGGMDVDFLCRSRPEEIRKRCRAMIERTATRGGWALGSGNSIPEYVPLESYLAMIECAGEAV